MARQIINVGTSANDGTGDTLRASQQKANSNFQELYETGGANITVNNPVTNTETTLDDALADLETGGSGVPTLDEVLGEGNTATDKTLGIYDSASTDDAVLGYNLLSFYDASENSGIEYMVNKIRRYFGSQQVEVEFTTPTGTTGKILFPDVVNATKTVAMTDQIPAPITIDATPTDGSANAVSSNGVFDALATKENSITAGTTSQYFRGDKTFQTLDKNAVGLGNVDNTSDLNKPVSTATQTQLNNRTLNIVKRATASSPVTGTTVESILTTDEIVGNTFSTNDILQLVSARFIKTGALGTCTYRIRINTTNSLSGAVTIATLNNAGIYAKIGNRTFTITGGNIRGYNFTDNGISSGQDTGSASLAEASTAYNPANSIFIFTTAQLANGGDSTICREFLITN